MVLDKIMGQLGEEIILTIIKIFCLIIFLNMVRNMLTILMKDKMLIMEFIHQLITQEIGEKLHIGILIIK